VKQIPNPVTQSQIDATWMNLSPSTHHDFITGTATDYVYHGEQQPLLARAIRAGQAYKTATLRAIAGKVRLFLRSLNPELGGDCLFTRLTGVESFLNSNLNPF
jgi:hypothetical protein